MNRVTKILGTKYPLVQAPMSWLTDAKLVNAVGNAGGLGILGPNAGRSKVVHGPEQIAQSMREEVKKIDSKIPFGINIIAPSPSQIVSNEPYSNEMLKMAFEEKVRFFAIVGDPHEELFQIIKQHNGIILFRPLTPSVEKMKLAEQYGADILIATGRDEGGVLPNSDQGTFTVIPTMVDAVSIPVLGAGGINDSRGVKAAFALGAEGVYLGSRFLATKESPVDERVKSMLISNNYEDMVEISKTQRSLKTKRAVELSESDFDPAMNLLPAMKLGNVDQGIITVNTGVDSIKDIPNVNDLISRLMK